METTRKVWKKIKHDKFTKQPENETFKVTTRVWEIKNPAQVSWFFFFCGIGITSHNRDKILKGYIISMELDLEESNFLHPALQTLFYKVFGDNDKFLKKINYWYEHFDK